MTGFTFLNSEQFCQKCRLGPPESGARSEIEVTFLRKAEIRVEKQ